MGGWAMGIESWLWMGSWVVVMFAAVWLLVREPRRSSSDEALDVLRIRFARGEISEEEFERARRMLGA